MLDQDGTHQVIARGETQTFRFPLPATFVGRERVAVTVVAHGYYVPQRATGAP